MPLLARVVTSVTDDKVGHTSLVECYRGKNEVPEDKLVLVSLSTTSHTDRVIVEPSPLTTEDGMTHGT